MPTPKRSKSERKRAAHAAQTLGERLIDLPDDVLASLELDERIVEAIADARRMKAHEALRRQKQYIGKLMQNIDVAPIQAYFDRLAADDRGQKRVFANAERWRDRLVREGAGALPAFETDIGNEQPELRELLGALDRAVSDRAETTLRREIFRQVHAVLAARAADG